jgi:hypothetical protein
LGKEYRPFSSSIQNTSTFISCTFLLFEVSTCNVFCCSLWRCHYKSHCITFVLAWECDVRKRCCSA